MLHIDRDGAFVVWTITRPEAKNALDATTLEALTEATRDASRDKTIRAAILTGAGDVFVSGGDLRALRDRNSEADAESFAEAGASLMRAYETLEIPVICAMPGAAIGGGAELAVACDLRVAEPKAVFSFKQVRMGVTTAWGTAARLVSLVGPSAAARLLYTACDVGADEAKTLGLVDAISDEGKGLHVALAWAHEISLGSPTAIAHMKAVLREARAPRPEVATAERRHFVKTWAGADHAEAVDAYFERRSPSWKIRL